MDNDALRLLLVGAAIGIITAYPVLHRWALFVCKIVFVAALGSYLFWVFFITEEPAMELLFGVG